LPSIQGEHGVAVVDDLAGAHQGIEFLGGFREVGDRLAELDHLCALRGSRVASCVACQGS
jgi:hypothetical protein